MQVACCQFDIRWEDKPANYARVRAMVASAGLAPGSLLVLPEMFATGYSMAAERVAEEPGGPTFAFRSELAARHAVHVVGGVAVRAPDGRARNEAVAFAADGRLVAPYAKMHLFTYAGEHDHYAPGDAVATFDWSGCAVAPAVCYDLRFPELFRRAAGGGEQLFVVIANWPVAREPHWLALLRARAIENQAYVVGVNRVGTAGDGTEHVGDSRIVSPTGELLATAAGVETVLVADVDAAEVAATRDRFRFLADRRG